MLRPVYKLRNRRGEEILTWFVNVSVEKTRNGFIGRLNFRDVWGGKQYVETVEILPGERPSTVMLQFLDAHLAALASPF